MWIWWWLTLQAKKHACCTPACLARKQVIKWQKHEWMLKTQKLSILKKVPSFIGMFIPVLLPAPWLSEWGLKRVIIFGYISKILPSSTQVHMCFVAILCHASDMHSCMTIQTLHPSPQNECGGTHVEITKLWKLNRASYNPPPSHTSKGLMDGFISWRRMRYKWHLTNCQYSNTPNYTWCMSWRVKPMSICE